MKIINRILIILLLGAIPVITSCGDDDENPPQPSALDLKKEDLINGGLSWRLGTVKKDDYDVTDQFSGFRLTVGDFTYAVTNSTGNAWPKSSGSWQFGNKTGTVVVRDDGVNINVEVTSSTLKLTFEAPDPSGRMEGVGGTYVFQLVSE